MILTLFKPTAFAMFSATETPADNVTIAKVTNLASYKDCGFSFIPVKYDGLTNGVAVTGIGGKENTDESIQIFSRVKTSASDNFRTEISFANYMGEDSNFKWVYDSTTKKYWFGTDIVYEFKIMPNKHVIKTQINGPGLSGVTITGLSTTKWTDIKIVIDADKKTSYTYVNGVLYKTSENLSTSTLKTPYLRVVAITTVPDEFAEQSEIEKDEDVWFYFDDLHIYTTTVSYPTVYLSETDLFNLSKGGRITSDDGSNEITGGVFGKPAGDKVFKMTTNTTAASERVWYGYSSSEAPIVTDLTTKTMDTIYETSFVITENVTDVRIENNSVITTFNANDGIDKLRINQWNKVKAVYNPNTTKWKVYLNGKFYKESATALEGKYRYAFNTPTTVSDVVYLDNVKVYQAATGVEDFEEATIILPETYEISQNKTVAQIKSELGIEPSDNPVVYEDDTYQTTLSDADVVSDGNIVVTNNQNDIFQYCTISSKIHGNITYGGTAINDDNTFSKGTLKINAYSNKPANIYAVQYNTSGSVIDVAISETETGNLNMEYETKDIEGKLKIFLWDTDYKPISEAITLDYKKSLDVLIIGNSYSRDTLFYTREIAKEFDVDVRTCLAYQSGKNLTYHYENRENDALLFYVNDLGGAAVGTNVSLKSIITNPNFEWDIIILQNYYAGTAVDSLADTMWVNGLNLAEYIHNLVPEAKLMLNQIWSVELGYSTMTSEEVQDKVDKYLYDKNNQFAADIKEKLNLDYDVEVGYVGKAIATARDYVDDNGIKVFGSTYSYDAYVAVGDAYKGQKYNFGYGIMTDEEKNAGMIKINRDGGHITPIARYLASAIWFEIITGKSILNSTYMPPEETNIGCSVPQTNGDSYYLYGSFVAPDKKYVDIMKSIAHQTNNN